LDGKEDKAATLRLVETLRTASNDEACDEVAAALGRGLGPQSVWDAMHLAAGELLMRQTGIVALHAVTTTNALRYAYQASADPHTRLMALLQNAAFLPMFRGAMGGRGDVGDDRIDELQPADEPAGVDDVFAALGDDRRAAARSTLKFLAETGDAKSFIDA